MPGKAPPPAPARKTDAKARALRSHGALHLHPEEVHDPLFVSGEEFFDARDLIQLRYEMLRRVRIDGQAITSVCAAYGFTRPVFYKSQQLFAGQGLLGLVPKKRGPHGGHKLTGEIVTWLQEILRTEGKLSVSQLAQRVKDRYGLDVHSRTIRRALVEREKKRR
jgi:transposase